jgi:putative mRNA 3-end processing factor
MVNDMQLRFLGGSDRVGSLAMLLDVDGKHLLFDYGMTPSKPPEVPLPAPPVDRVFLSHAHLDHSGMIPVLTENGEMPIHCTPVTSSISHLLHKDSLKIAETEGYAPPYSPIEIKKVKHYFDDVKPKDSFEISPMYDVRFHDAGHIPGSLMVEVSGSKKLLFTGDFNTVDTHLVKGTKPVDCDVLVMEGTYAGRDHPKGREELEKEFIDKIDEVVTRGGVAVLPAFAVSRSQEIAMILRKSGFNIWFDGMGRKVSKMFLKYPEYLSDPGSLKKAINAINMVHSDHGRKLALESEVILTSSGMMDGGPVLHYMNKLKHDPKSAVILTGYQVEGTNSRLLVDQKKLNFYGVVESVSCEIQYYDFSGHAGHSDLVNFAKGCKPEKIVIMHSENREALTDELQDFSEVILPHNDQLISL